MSWQRAIVGASFSRSLIRGLALGALLLVVSRTLVVPIRATGISMLPTYADGQLLFFNTLAYTFDDPARGDIVAITLEGGDAVLVKRVVALPGERVRIAQGVVFVDDAPLLEPYAHRRAPWNMPEATIAAGECFVIGDNRGMNPRNHTFGSVSRERLYGRLMF